MSELSTALESRKAPPEQKGIRDLIDRMKPELEKSLGTPDAAARLARHYLTAIRLNPKLYECSAESLLAALLLSAQVGLDPGPLGHVYLVPYGSECSWILGYTGMVELARRSGRVAGLVSELVWNCDEYRSPWRDEKGLHYRHVPGPLDERTERVAVLVTWREMPGRVPMAVECPPSRIDRARKASRAAAKSTGPWVTDEDAMWRKTGIRFARPFLPLGVDAAQAFAADYARAVAVEVDADGAAQAQLVPAEDDDGAV